MNTPLSLVQELRGIRGGQKHNQNDLEGLLSEIHEARREWQEQVDQAQRLMRELLGAISELSGVELPGISIDPQKDGDGSLRLGFKTLKDRIRNELEAFASTSAVEVSKQFEGRSQVVMDPLEREMSARMDNLADEFRGKLQARLEAEQEEVANQSKLRIEGMLQTKMDEFAQWIKLMTEGTVSSVPASVEKAIAPHVEEVKARLKSSFQQELGMVLVEMERTGQGRLEGLQKEVEALIRDLPERARQACSASTDQAMKDLNGHLESARDEFSSQFKTGAKSQAEESLNDFKTHLSALTSSSRDEFRSYADSHVEGFKQNLESASKELQEKKTAEILSKVSDASQEALKASLAQVQQRLDETLEHSKGELRSSMAGMLEDVRKQMNDAAQSTRDTISGQAAGISENLKSLGERMNAAQNEQIAAVAENLTKLSQQTIEGHTQSLKQVFEAQLQEIRGTLGQLQTGMASDYEAQLRRTMEAQRVTMMEQVQRQAEEASCHAVEKIRTSSAQVVQDLSGKVNKEVNTATTLLNQWAHQTTVWAESSIKESLESYKRQVAEFTDALLNEQRTTIQGRIGDLQGRLEQAARLLRIQNEESGAAPKHEGEPQHV